MINSSNKSNMGNDTEFSPLYDKNKINNNISEFAIDNTEDN